MSNELFKDEIKPEQEWNGHDCNFEPDSSPETWDHYKRYYNNFGSFGELACENSRLCSNVSVDDITYKIAGDCSFNFNTIKVHMFTSIIDNDLNIKRN